MKARDVMSRPVYRLHPWTAIREATVLLTETGLSALPVVDEDDLIVGIVSESDVLDRGLDEPDGLVRNLMTPAVEVVSVDADVGAVARRMLQLHLHSVPVAQDGILVGVIGRRDLLRVLVRDDDVIATKIRRDLADYAGIARRWHVEVVNGTVRIAGEFADEAERSVLAALARTVTGVVEVELVRINEVLPTRAETAN
jgi:predicted transcriptional regulator